MNEYVQFKPGDEVIIKNNERSDIMTVLKVDQSNKTIECFEYNPINAYIISMENVEKL
jgi:hypothetical protein